MKRYLYLLGAAVALLIPASCNKIEEVNTPDQIPGIPFEIVANSPEVKTENDGFSTKWVAEDAINVFHAIETGGIVSDGQFTVSDIDAGLFSGTVSSDPVVGTEYNWYAIYPYDSNLNTLSGDKGTNRYYTIGSGVGEVQTQSETGDLSHLAGTKLPLYGVTAAKYNGQAPFIQMNQLASVAAITITNSTTADISVASVTFTAPESVIGTYYLNILGDNPVYTDSGTNYVSNTATLNVTDGSLAKDATGVYYIAIKPFTAPSGSTISVTVTTTAGDSQTKTFSLAKNYTFSAGKYKTVKMDFTTEHVDLGTTYYQISSLDDITSDGSYIFVLPDVATEGGPFYYVLNNSGTSSNLDNLTKSIKVDEDSDVICLDSPDNKYIWKVATTSGNGFNFRNTTESSYSCIWNPNSSTSINTSYAGSQYWIPELLPSGCFKFSNTNTDARFLACGTTTADAKAYKTPGTFYDQVQDNYALPKQYAGAWMLLKLGAKPEATPQIIATPTAITGVSYQGVEDASDITIRLKAIEGTVEVTCDGTVVTAAANVDNTIVYTVSPNNTGAEREGWIKIAMGEINTTIPVIQSAFIQEITIDEFLTKEVGDTYYRLTGTVTDLESGVYGNFTLVDETGAVYVYGLTATKVTTNDKSFASLGIVEGDIVTLEGKRAEHNDTPQVGGPAYYISHTSAPSLTVDVSNLVFNAEGGTKTVVVTANNFSGSVSIYADSNNEQFTVTVSENTITITAAENTGNEVQTGEITVTAMDDVTSKTVTIQVSQNKPVQTAQNGDILWQEDFTGYNTTLPGTASGTHVFGGGTVTYSIQESGTKLYSDALAHGTAPELLVSKNNGALIVSGIPTGRATAMTLTYKANYDYCIITPNNGITLRSDATFENNVKTVYLVVPSGVTSFDLEIKNTNSSNCRVDDFMLVAGAPKLKENQTITFGENKLVEWVIGTDCTLNVAKQGLTVTGAQTDVTYESSDTEVATVDNEGKVTPLKAGTIIITATAEESEDYKPATDTYTLKITDPNTIVEPTVVLSESFDDTSTSDSNSAITSSTFANFSGETSRAYKSQYGGIKLGASGNAGYITSKALDLSSDFTVKLNVLKYGSDTGKVQVTVGSVTKEITPTTTDTAYTLEFDAATANATVKIGTSSKRAYIDTIVITRY